MVGELCVSALFDCGLMILAKREFNKLKYRICCGMLSTVDEFFIFVWNGTLQVFLSIKVDWSGFSLSPLQFLRSGEVISDTTKQMIVTLWLRVERNHETILLSGMLPGANQIFRFLVLCHSLYFLVSNNPMAWKKFIRHSFACPIKGRQWSETQKVSRNV